MPFWSGEKLAERIGGLIKPPDLERINCAAYQLALGPEVFVTSDQRFDDSPVKGLKIDLEPGDQCRIPPGQFAFLLTEEEVSVPSDAIAFISIRTRYKFKGLVNVSGFHVDPGWKGRLIFGVYNAGPSPVVLSRGSEMFLIWFADLDRASESRKNIEHPQVAIPDELTEGMSGQVFSPIALGKDVIELKEKAVELKEEFSEKHSSLRVELAELRTDYGFYKKLLIGAAVIVVGLVLREVVPLIFHGGTRTPSATTQSTVPFDSAKLPTESAKSPVPTVAKPTDDVKIRQDVGLTKPAPR